MRQLRRQATLTDCTISGNSASYGGGLNNHGTATLNGCTISNNTASSSGGGLQTFGGTLTLTDCTVSGNSAGSNGGGLYINNGGTLSLTDCTVSDNNAYNGGGLWSNGTTTLTNVHHQRQYRQRLLRPWRRRPGQQRRHSHADRLHRQRQ